MRGQRHPSIWCAMAGGDDHRAQGLHLERRTKRCQKEKLQWSASIEEDQSSTVEREDTTHGARPGCHRGTPAIRSHFLPPASIGQLLTVLPDYPGLDADKPAKAAARASVRQRHSGLSREVMHGCLDFPKAMVAWQHYHCGTRQRSA